MKLDRYIAKTTDDVHACVECRRKLCTGDSIIEFTWIKDAKVYLCEDCTRRLHNMMKREQENQRDSFKKKKPLKNLEG